MIKGMPTTAPMTVTVRMTPTIINTRPEWRHEPAGQLDDERDQRQIPKGHKYQGILSFIARHDERPPDVER